jgi:polysaccharide export outer membrane protein
MFRRLQVWMILSLIAVVMPAQAQQAAHDKQPAAQSAAEDTSAASSKAATQDPNYIIGAQDVLDISVWKEPEVSRVVPVRPDGKISLPLLNDVQAAGLTPSQLAAQLTVSLKKYVTSPQVTVIVATINSQRVYIIGEVLRPGAFPMLPGMNVLQGLSSAGGFTQFAKTKSIYVLRMENGKQQKYPVNYKEVVSGKHPDQDILLKAGDTIVVP